MNWVRIALIVAALVVAAVVWYVRRRRRGPIHVLGPLFWHELVRLARRGQQTRFRVVFGLFLLGALFITYINAFPQRDPVTLLIGEGDILPLEQVAQFAEDFFVAFMMVQMAVVVLLTPVYAAGAITEEKERKTLEFLLATELTNHEIILGKFSARLVYVAAVLLSAAPVLALTQLFGGVDISLLLMGYAVTAVTLVSLGAFSLYCAMESEDLRTALLRIYGFFLLVTILSSCCGSCIPGFSIGSPFLFLLQILKDIDIGAGIGTFIGFWGKIALLGIYAAAHLGLAAVCVVVSIRRVRTQLIARRYVRRGRQRPSGSRSRRSPPPRRRSRTRCRWSSWSRSGGRAARCGLTSRPGRGSAATRSCGRSGTSPASGRGTWTRPASAA